MSAELIENSIDNSDENKRANPYVGPQTFKRAQKDLFFGRESEANELISLVVARRLILFYAESGAGKSSLINARLIPKLEEERNFEVLPIARVSGESPRVAVDNIYIYNLMNCLSHEQLDAEHCAHLSLSDFLLNLVQVDGKYLYQNEETPDETADEENERINGNLAESEADDGASDEIWPRVLIIDQFEELFITHHEAWEKRRDFFVQLNQAMQDDPYLYVVLSMREDHIAKLSSYARLLPGELRSRYRMQRMRKEAAIAAITGPAQRRGIRFTPQAVNDLVSNLLQVQSVVGEEIQIHEGPFVEPVQLQVVCFRLWDLLVDDADGTITQKELHAIVNNDLSEFVSKALADFYELALTYVLPKVEGQATERQIRNWFSTELITPTGTRNLVFEGDERTGSLPNDVVYLLASRFLVRAESRASGKWYELVHDRFVNPILRANEAWREEQIKHDPLALAAREWQANDQAEELLYRDRILQRALASVDWPSLDPLARQFLAASRDAQQKREMEEARLRADQSERDKQAALLVAEREQRISDRLRLQRVIMVILLLAAGVAARIAWDRGTEFAEQLTINERQYETIRVQFEELETQREQITDQNIKIRQNLEAMEVTNRELVTEKLRSSAFALTKAASSLVAEPAARLLLAHSALMRALDPDLADERSLALNARNTLLQALLTYGPVSLVPTQQSSGAVGLAYSPDGRMLAVGYENGNALLWDTTTLSGRRTIQGHSNSVLGVAFHPDGRYLATGSRDGAVIVWDAETGEEIWNFRGHNRGVVAVAFHPDGDLLASAGFDGVAKLWDLTSGGEVASFHGHSDALQSVIFTPDGNTLLTASADATAIAWTITTGEERFRLAEHTDGVTHLAVTQDGRLWATASDDGSAILWDAETGESIRRFCCHNGWIDGIAFSPDGTLLATASEDHSVGLWQVETGIQLQRYTAHTDQVWEVQFSPDGRYLASASWDDRVYLYPLRDSELVQSFPYTSTLTSLVVSDDRQTFAAREDDRRIRVWRNEPGLDEKNIEISEPVATIALDHTGEKIALLTESGHVEVWTPGEKKGTPLASEIVPREQITMARLQFLSDDQGLVLVAPNAESQLQVIGDPTRTAVYTQALTGIRGRDSLTVTDLVLAQDGQHLATVNLSGTVSVWSEGSEPRTVAQIQTTSDEDASDEASDEDASDEDASDEESSTAPPLLKFSDDGRYLAIKIAESALLIWDTGQATVVTRFEPAQSTIVDFDFDRAGRQLAVALVDRADVPGIHLLDLAMTDVAPLAIPLDGKVERVIMGIDSILVFAEGQATQIHLLPNQDLLALPCARVQRNLTYTEWQTVERDLGDINQSRICAERPLHSSVLHAYLLSTLDGGKELPLDLEAAQVTDEDLQRGYIQLAQERLAGSDFTAAHRLLQQASQSIEQPSPVIQSELAQTYQQLCANSDGMIQQTACAEATSWVVQINDAQLNHELCQAGAHANRLDDVYAACERAVDLATAGENLFRNLSFCPSSQIKGLDIYDSTCAHAVTIAEDTENLPAITDACAQSVAGGYVDLVLPICQRTIQLTAAIGDEDAFEPNVQLCRLAAPEHIPDLFAESCDRVATLAPSIQNGSTVTGSVQSEEGDYWRFTATTELVTIEMHAQSTWLFDTYLTLYDNHLQHLIENDDWQGTETSLIQSFAVEPNTNYYVRAHGFDGATGDYALTVTFEQIEEIGFDAPVMSNFAETTSWQFNARAGDVIDVQLTANELSETARLDLVTSSGEQIPLEPQLLASGDFSVRQVLLPYDGEYQLKPRDLGSTAVYTLALTHAPVPSWPWGETTVVSGTTETTLWRIESDAPRWARIALDTTDETYNPYLELLQANGNVLASNDDGGDGVNALIDGILLAEDTTYLARINRHTSPAPYQLTVSSQPVADVNVGETVDLSMQGEERWVLRLDTGGVISITVDVNSDDGYLELRDPDGYVIASATGLPATLQERLNHTERPYLILLRTGAAIGPGTLSLNKDPFPVLMPGVPQHSSTRANPWWQFEAEAGDRVNLLLAGASPSYDPYLTLYNGEFSSLAANDDNSQGWSGFDAEIREFVIPETGVYYVEVGRPDNSAPYELTLTVH